MDLDTGATMPGVTIHRSDEPVCWWCHIDPIDGAMSGLQHPDYRYLCRKCRQIMEIFADHFGAMHGVRMLDARSQLMRFLGFRCVAIRLEMQEMRDRVDELLHKAHQEAAWINGVPAERTSGAPRLSHAPRVEIPVHVQRDRKKDVE